MSSNPLHVVYEILARRIAFAYENPTIDQDFVRATLQNLGYTVDQFFNDSTTGFQALGLVSAPNTPAKPPLLVIRGTDGVEDEPALSNPTEIGLNQFTANRIVIEAWLRKFEQSPVRATVIGHSLGGAIAQRIAAEFVPLISEVVTFNSPGISEATATLFVTNGGTGKLVTHYIVNGDVVSLGGRDFIDGRVILQSFTDPAINPIYALDKHFQIEPILSNRPPGYTKQEITVDVLSGPGFNFNNDSDYRELLAGLGAVQPEVAQRITTRQSVEELRTSPGFSFSGLIFGARAALAPERDNLLVGDDAPNTADAKAGNDQILGNGGDDVLRGGTGNDVITGGRGDDRLFGGDGNDILLGNRGNDVLVGVNAFLRPTGIGSIDILWGGRDNDRFVLGDRDKVYYNDGNGFTAGLNDYALITDFTAGDVIQLRGDFSQYRLQNTTLGQPLGTAIFRVSPRVGGQDELIAIAVGTTGLNLNSTAFLYV